MTTLNGTVIRWDDVPEHERASYSYSTHRGCGAAVKNSYGISGYSLCAAGVNHSTGFCRKHSEKLGLLEPLPVRRLNTRVPCVCGQDPLRASWQYCPACGAKLPDIPPPLSRSEQFMLRHLKGHTLLEVAQLRRDGVSWKGIARSFGLKTRRHTQEPEWAVESAWEEAGEPGKPNIPPDAEHKPPYEGPLWDAWRFERRAARDRWLVTLVTDG